MRSYGEESDGHQQGWQATRCKWPLNITNGSDDVAEDNDCNDNYNYPLKMLSGCEVWRKTETYDGDCNDVKKKKTDHDRDDHNNDDKLQWGVVNVVDN